jgi:hypothetical protein
MYCLMYIRYLTARVVFLLFSWNTLMEIRNGMPDSQSGCPLVDCRVLFGHGRLLLVVLFGAVAVGSEVTVVGELHRVGQ